MIQCEESTPLIEGLRDIVQVTCKLPDIPSLDQHQVDLRLVLEESVVLGVVVVVLLECSRWNKTIYTLNM